MYPHEEESGLHLGAVGEAFRESITVPQAFEQSFGIILDYTSGSSQVGCRMIRGESEGNRDRRNTASKPRDAGDF